MYETTAELLTYIYQLIGDTNPTSSTTQHLTYLLNEAQLVVHGGGGEFNVTERGDIRTQPVIFPWAISTTNLQVNTVPKINTGTIWVTQESTSATLSAVQATSLAGWYIRIGDDNEVYRITSHTGGTDAITLDTEYTNDTNATASYEAFKLDYTFGTTEVLLPANNLRCRWLPHTGLSLVDVNELDKQYPLDAVAEGLPEVAGIVAMGDGFITVRLSHYPEEIETLALPYVSYPSELETSGPTNPTMPKAHRRLLAHIVAFYYLRDENDDKALSYFKSATDMFKALRAHARQFNNYQDRQFGRFRPFQRTFGSVFGHYFGDHPLRNK